MEVLLDGWDCGDNDVYDFFEKENIDVSGCSEFDFKKRTKKPRQVKIAKKSQVQKDNLNAKTTTAEGQKDISNEVDSANKNQGKRDYDNGCFICDHAHSPNDLKLEENAAYAKKNNFLYEKRCKKCSKMFVDKQCVEKEDKEYVVSYRSVHLFVINIIINCLSFKPYYMVVRVNSTYYFKTNERSATQI